MEKRFLYLFLCFVGFSFSCNNTNFAIMRNGEEVVDDTVTEPLCSTNEMQCIGDVVKECVDGEWKTWNNCEAQGMKCLVEAGVPRCYDGEIKDSADSVDDGDSADSVDGGDSANSVGDGDSADSGDDGDSADSVDDGDSADSGGEAYPAPYGFVTFNGAFDYILTDESPPTDGMMKNTAFATGEMRSKNIISLSNHIVSQLSFNSSDGGNYFLAGQTPLDENSITINPAALFQIYEDKFLVNNNVGVGLTVDDDVIFYIADVDWSTHQLICMHAFAIGTMSITEAIPTPGAAGSFVFNGTLDLYSPANATPYGGDITTDLGIDACAPY